MKYFIRFFALFFVLLLVEVATSQPWTNMLSQEKADKKELSFYDYQKAFYEYWEPFHVDKGYYLNREGEKTKAPGWKQFKRWEHYWETRVDKQTGEFPTTSTREIYQKAKASLSANRSLSGDWSALGPDNTGGGYAGLGRINCIAFHPANNNMIYIGAASGGIWKTSNGGTSWNPLGDDNAALGVSDILVIVNGSSETVYLATGDKDHSDTYSVGVLKSIDGGATWQTTGLDWTANQQRLIYKMLMDPVNQNILYAATSNGFYKTINAGTTWTQLINSSYVDVEFDPSNNSILYSSDTDGKVYKSINSGQNWTIVHSVTGGKRTELAVTSDNPAIVYALVSNAGSGLKGIYKSTDFGNSFTLTFNSFNLMGWDCDGSDSGGQAWYDLCIAADPNDENTLFAGGVNTWKSIDGGFTWNISNHWSSSCSGNATTVHADKHTLVYRHNTSVLFEGNDGGIYKTDDSGSSWDHIGNTLEISQMYRISCAQTNNTDVMTGLQDNGSKMLANNGWTDVYGGDGMECIIDFTDDNTQYASLYFGSVFRTINKWNSSYYITGGVSGNAAWVTPYTLDPSDHLTLYIGFQDVWKSTNQGANWTQISSWGGNTLQSLAVAPSNSNYIYAATYNTIYGTSNAGGSWSDITGSLPVGTASITYIWVKNDDPSTLWVTMSGFNALGVFQSTDGGSTWSDISTGLPEIPINSIIQNKQNTVELELYAGTDVGVYLKLGSANWVPFFDGLPNVVVNELDIFYDDSNPQNSLLRAGTFGRGLWESDLYSGSPAGPVADFEGSPLTGTEPLEVTFTDLSVGTIDTWDWDFGDGEQSSDQNPLHTYTSYGVYTVSLTVSGSNGNDTETKTDYIEVTALPPVADFEANPITGNAPLLVSFTSLSTGIIDSWVWDLGNGSGASGENIAYTYEAPGYYTITLTVTGPGGSDMMTKTDYIEVFPVSPPVVDFSATPTFGEAPLQVTFTNLTTGQVDQYDWSFGDGGASQDEHPVHEYVAVGNYTVVLTATGPGGTVTETKVDYILIPVGIDNEITGAYIVYPNPVTNTLQIQFPDKQKRLLILTNVTGNQLFETTSEDIESHLDMSKYKSGIYWLTIREKGETVARVKVIRK